MTESFTAKEIVSIIAACHKNRVKKLKMGDLTIKFSLDAEQQELELPSHFVEPESTDINESLKAEDPFLNQLEQQTLLMEDPAEFERQLMQEQRELEPDAIFAERTKHDVHGSGHGT